MIPGMWALIAATAVVTVLMIRDIARNLGDR